MKRLVSLSGFTIVEVLIVLSVTGVIIAATLPFISGKQSRTQYTIGMNQIQSQISSVINNISTGNIPVNGSYQCKASSTTGFQISSGLGSGNTGVCQFVGEAIYFKANSMTVIPLVGLRADSSGVPIQNISNAKTCPMLDLGINSCSTFSGSTTYSYSNGIVLSKYANNSISDSNGGLVSILSISRLPSVAQAQQNGSISMDTFDLSIVSNSSQSIYDSFTTKFASPLVLNKQIDLCFYNSATNQHGTISLSVNGSPSEVSLNNASGVC